MSGTDWGGRLVISPGRLLYVGPAATAERHAHHAIQFVVGLEANVSLKLDKKSLSRQATVVCSGAAHAFDAGGRRIALLLVDSHDARVRATAKTLHGEELGPHLEVAEVPSTEWEAPRLMGWAESILKHLGLGAERRLVSGATQRALRSLEESLDAVPRLGVAARHARLSPSRLSHLFRAEVGLPFRRYVLWARLRRAAEAAARGASMTECAVIAGFSDGAHFSRTFRRHFGLSPSVVLPMIEQAWPRVS